MATPQELLASGVDPAAAEAQQFKAALDAAGATIVTPEEAATPAPVAEPDFKAQLDAVAPTVDLLDIFSDDVLVKDKTFDPKEEYIQRGGAAAFDAKDAARLGRIRKGQEADRSVVGTVAAQLGNIIPAVPRLIAGVGKGIAAGLHAAGVVRPQLLSPAAKDPGFQAEYKKISDQQAAESLSGAVAETAGLVTGAKKLGETFGIIRPQIGQKPAKKWSELTDEEAFRRIIEEGESERELRAMSQGDIPALAPIREELAEQGVPVRPEKVQEAAERGLVGWLGFGAGIKLGGAAVKGAATQATSLAPKSVLSAVEKAEQLAALRTARDAALKAQQAGPKTAATEAALKTAQENFQAAEAAVGESNLAGALDFASRAQGALSEFSGTAAQNVIGRPVQLAGAVTEGLAKIVTKTPRWVGYLGSIGGLFIDPTVAIGGILAREVAAPLVQRAGVAAKGYGKAVAEGQARRTLDVLGAAGDVATTSLSQYPLDYAFSVGMSDTEQEARAAAPIATALGVGPGVGRGVRRIVTGELITPKGTPAARPSPAYGENKVLDTAHATAMKTVDAKSEAQVNWVREFARKMGGRVYLMPDTATFESTLREVWKQQNPGVEITPAMEAQFKQAADQQGFSWGEFTAADGARQPTVFIKNPEAAVHEMGHILEKVMPEQVNTRLDEQILNRLSPENIEAAGSYYAKRLGRTEPWREVLSQLNPELSAEQYLAREIRAENLGVALQNRGEAFATSPGLYRWLAQTVAKIGDVQGIPLTQSEALGFPVFGDVMRAGEKAAGKILGDEAGQELIQARDVRLKAATPKTEPKAGRSERPIVDTEVITDTAAAEGAKGIVMAEELAARDPGQAEILRKISTAISTGQALKIDYRSAPGEPAGSPNISREARREIIEAFRDMPESVRPLWEKTSIPFRLETTKNKGVQILTYSPEVFAANARKLSQFISDTGTQRLSPYEIDPATKTFTPDGWQKLYNDVQTFTANQRAGGTGSGVPLTLPANAAEMRISVPPVNEAALTPMPQATADFINVIFHLPPPETPRVSRKGGTPANIVAQEIARANEPLIGPRVTEPGRARSEKEFKGFEGRRIQEVNPLRAELEKAATKDIKFPSLIETNQRLNLEHLADATLAPEVLATLPVTETLRAGFLPAAGREWKITGQRGGIRSETTVRAADETTARKLATAQGFRVEKASLVPPSEGALGQFLPGEMNTSIWRKPVKEIGNEILAMSPEQFNDATQNWRGGLTAEAQRVGLGLQAKEDVAVLRDFEKQARERAAVAMKEKNYDDAMSLSSISQFFREASETAQGTGSMGETLRKNLGEAYKPPFPLDK